MSDWHENNERVEAELDNARGNGANKRMMCIFCADQGHTDRKYSLSVNTDNGFWRCFRCGMSSRLNGFADQVDYGERGAAAEEEVDEFERPKEFLPIYGSTSYSLRPARDYLRGKGDNGRPVPVPKKRWKQADLYACSEGYWRNRIIVPYKTADGVWRGWISRIWWNKPPKRARGMDLLKYFYPPDMDRGAMLYNHRAMLIETDRPLIVVEGAFDTFNLWNDAVACLGDLSNNQFESLMRSDRPICFVLDGDAWQKGWALAARFRFEKKRAGHVKLEAGQDPDEVPKDWLLEQARRSIDAPL